jgi:hypothetical protein
MARAQSTPPYVGGGVCHVGSTLRQRGVPWARIGEQAGQSDLAVTPNTYTHVLLDEPELDYAGFLTDHAGPLARAA